MNVNWNEIVYIIKSIKDIDCSKDELLAEIQNCFRILGWRKSNGTLIQNFQLKDETLIDLALVDSQKSSFCIPIYVEPLNNSHDILHALSVLDSYVGLVIGDTIDIYYLKKEDDVATCVGKISIDTTDELGSTLCHVLYADDFQILKLIQFCDALTELNSPISKLKKEIERLVNTPLAINSIIKSYLSEQGFEEQMIDKELANLKVECTIATQKPSNKKASANTKTHVHRDHTQFSFDGEHFYSKRVFVLELIKQYVQDNPYVTYSDLEDRFPSDIISKERGVIRPLSQVQEWIRSNSDLSTRYFLKKEDIITLKNGSQLVVYNQWGTSSFPLFLEIAKTLYPVQSNHPYEFEKKLQTEITISSQSLNSFAKNK